MLFPDAKQAGSCFIYTNWQIVNIVRETLLRWSSLACNILHCFILDIYFTFLGNIRKITFQELKTMRVVSDSNSFSGHILLINLPSIFRYHLFLMSSKADAFEGKTKRCLEKRLSLDN